MSGLTIRHFSRMVPRIRAEEAIQLANAFAAGAGSMTPESFNGWLRSQQDDMRTGNEPLQVLDMAAHAQKLAGSGFGVALYDKDGNPMDWNDLP